MHQLRRHARPAPWRLARWPVTSVAAILLAACLSCLVGGSGHPASDTRIPTPLESIGAPPPGQVPLALTGPRSLAVAVSLQEGRQRFGQIVEPGELGRVDGVSEPGAGLTPVEARPAYLVAYGPLAARAPPVALI
jgi:hypothetical protein